MSDNNQNTDPLALFTSKSGREKAANTSHIRRIRITLPIIAIILILTTTIWTFTSGDDFTKDLAQNAVKAIAKNELINPRFDSMDSKKQPYTITADRAVRGETDDNLVLLTAPTADITLTSGRWIAIKATTGAFNQNKNRLLLRENIQINDDQGYQLTTQEMNIDMKEETLLSETPIAAQGPAGTIIATGLYANLKDGLLSFKGPATVTLTTTNGKLGELR